MSTLDAETRALINKARTLGNSTPSHSIYLDDSELLRLCAVVAVELGQGELVEDYVDVRQIGDGYYQIPLKWFKEPINPSVSLEGRFLELRGTLSDFATYFKLLSELHKRRIKFDLILIDQPLPEMEQIVPRCLLEYGMRPEETLASWLVWRKWIYDIDNRSAQETGYLFEPILAAAIGGVGYSSRSSPIKRSGQPSRGRQVDCIDGKFAYEFKMRVTIAASGQGRFGEELDFAKDCLESGFEPILLVLDPTPSPRLSELAREYETCGGCAYIGDQAWEHLEEKAGENLSNFIERYIKKPIDEVSTSYSDKLLKPISLTCDTGRITIRIGDQNFIIERTVRVSDPDVCRK